MASSSEHGPADQGAAQAKVFSDLRRRNEHAARVARLLDANRQRRISQAIRSQRQHWARQSRGDRVIARRRGGAPASGPLIERWRHPGVLERHPKCPRNLMRPTTDSPIERG
jgi:hypothetical protein